jgi:hypothetical protein
MSKHSQREPESGKSLDEASGIGRKELKIKRLL